VDKAVSQVPQGVSVTTRLVHGRPATGDSTAREARHDYRFDPKSRMIFFSRLRASASTWSFHRSVAHSGRLGLAPEPDCAGLRAVVDGFRDV
jgi:hypothetical protein